jgi:plastocyanin
MEGKLLNRKLGFLIISVFLSMTLLVGCSTASSNKDTVNKEPKTETATTSNTPSKSEPQTASPQPSSTPEVKNYEVKIIDFAYNPAELTIEAGSTVTFTNFDVVKHTVTAEDNSFDSGLFGKDKTFEKTFESAGTYNIYCIPHPYMKLTIIVK